MFLSFKSTTYPLILWNFCHFSRDEISRLSCPHIPFRRQVFPMPTGENVVCLMAVQVGLCPLSTKTRNCFSGRSATHPVSKCEQNKNYFRDNRWQACRQVIEAVFILMTTMEKLSLFLGYRHLDDWSDTLLDLSVLLMFNFEWNT